MEGHKSFLEYEQDPNTDFKLLTMEYKLINILYII